MPGVTYMVQTPSDKVSVPPLISRSASRRFYFDVVNSAYGWRVQISQVTAHYRSIISFPINELVNFREKLNELMEELGIERPSPGPTPAQNGESRSTGAQESPGRRERANSRRGNSGGQRRPNRNRSFRRSRQERKSESEREQDSSVEKNSAAEKSEGDKSKEEASEPSQKQPSAKEPLEPETTEDKATSTETDHPAPEAAPEVAAS